MIKIDSNKNQYFPISHSDQQSKSSQNRHLRTEYSNFSIEEEFKNIRSYSKLYESIRNKNKPQQMISDNSLFIPKHVSQTLTEQSEMIQTKLEESKIIHVIKKMSEIGKQYKQHKKRYSCHDADKIYQRRNWMQNILRRKNNGSNGQIVRGLTGGKNDSILQRFQVVSSYREVVSQKLTKTPNLVEFGQKFIPLGLSQMKNQQITRKNVSQLKGKKKMNLYKKKSKINPAEYFETNSKMRTERNQKITRASFQSSLQLRPAEKVRITKKLTEPYKIERHNLGPWDIL